MVGHLGYESLQSGEYQSVWSWRQCSITVSRSKPMVDSSDHHLSADVSHVPGLVDRTNKIGEEDQAQSRRRRQEGSEDAGAQADQD